MRIFRIERSDKNKHDTLHTLKSIRDQATRGMKPPYRFIGRTITDTTTIEGMKLGMVVEKIGTNILKTLTARRCAIMTSLE